MLKIEKTKIKYFRDEGSKTYRNLTKNKGKIFQRLNNVVEIDSDVTFGDFIKLLIKEKDMIDVIFESSLYGVPFELLIKDFKRKPKKYDGDLYFLEVYWYIDLYGDEIIIKADFHGIGKANEDADEPSQPYALDFTPISELGHLPLRLNTDFEIIKFIKENGYQKEVVLKTTRTFTFYELVDAILYELTWYGTPQMRDKDRAEIFEQVDEIKKKLKTGNSLDELFKDIKTLDDVHDADLTMAKMRNEAIEFNEGHL